MTPTEREEFRQMATDIALLKQSQSKIVEPALVRINRKIDMLSFYTKSEVDDKIIDARNDIEEKLVAVQRRRWYENTISATFGALLTGVVMFIFNAIIGGSDGMGLVQVIRTKIRNDVVPFTPPPIVDEATGR